MVCINNTPGGYYGFILNPDSSSGIYITLVKEDQFCIVDKNRIKQDEIHYKPTLSKGQPTSSSERYHFIRYFPMYQTSMVSHIPWTNPLTLSSKLFYPYLLTPLRIPYSTWGEILVIFTSLRSKWSWRTFQRSGFRV